MEGLKNKLNPNQKILPQFKKKQRKKNKEKSKEGNNKWNLNENKKVRERKKRGIKEEMMSKNYSNLY